MLVYFDYTNLDLIIEDNFYDFAKMTWKFQDPGAFYYNIFYRAIKIPIFLIGLTTIIAYFYSLKKNIWENRRKGMKVVIFTLICLPAFITLIGKNISNVHCPDDITRYQGGIPYVKVFGKYPLNPHSPDGKFRRGHCFPAGHPAGGYALISLVGCFRRRITKIGAFLFAMILGTSMSLLQLFRGLHYVSHLLTTLILAFIFTSFFNLIIKDQYDDSIKTKK